MLSPNLLSSIAKRLAPLFQCGESDSDAQAVAAQALEAYHPQSAADCFRVARLLALSFATTAAVTAAASADITPAQHLRYTIAANSLSRSAERIEATLAAGHPRAQLPCGPVSSPADIKAQGSVAKAPQRQAQTSEQQDAAAMVLIDQAIAEFRRGNIGLRQPLPEPPKPPFLRPLPTARTTPQHTTPASTG